LAISSTLAPLSSTAMQTEITFVSPTWGDAEIARERKRAYKRKLMKNYNIFHAIMQFLTLG
tara:strand:- start:265 stop:447 length:183 start_codon:yes stop_codon:yes gene_type:complete